MLKDSRVNSMLDIFAIGKVYIPYVIRFLPWMLRFTTENLVHKTGYPANSFRSCRMMEISYFLTDPFK